ncbi:MAG: Uncharacterised protein [Flavobacteriales bacterium UBA4585]|nr:MAG: Uncharacterised protein [Flavobacteriales bacterium UBA4585]
MTFLKEHDVFILAALIYVLICWILSLLFRSQIIDIKFFLKPFLIEARSIGLDVVEELGIAVVRKFEGVAVEKYGSVYNGQCITRSSDATLNVVFFFIHWHGIHRVVKDYWITCFYIF